MTSDKLTILQEQAKIYRELGQNDKLGFVLGAQAELLYSRGQISAAVKLLEESEVVFRKINHSFGVEKALFDQVNILTQTSETTKLLSVLERQEKHYRESGEDEELAECLFNQTRVVHAQEDLRREVELCEQQIPLWQKLHNLDRVAFCYGSSAMSLVRLNERLDKALDMACEAERVSRQIGDASVLARAMNTKAFVLWQMKRTRDALSACVRSMKIANENNIAEWIEHNKAILQQLIREQLGAMLDMLSTKPDEANTAWSELEDAVSLIENAEVSQTMAMLRPLFSLMG